MTSSRPCKTQDTDNRARPFRRRALMTRCPFLVRIRARKPEVLLRLRLVPSSVRLVIGAYSASQKATVYHDSILSPGFRSRFRS